MKKKIKFSFSFVEKQPYDYDFRHISFPISHVFFFYPGFHKCCGATQHDAMRGECCHLSTMHTLVSVAKAKSISLYCSTILHYLRNLLRKKFLQRNITTILMIDIFLFAYLDVFFANI